MLVDSHCHLEYKGLVEDQANVLSRAREAGVGQFLNISTRRSEWEQVVGTAERESDVWASVGIHPHEADQHADLGRDVLIEATKNSRVIAIGETGLDNFYSAETHDWQRESFIRHLKAASVLKKPVIVHTRDARQETLDVLSEHVNTESAGVLHCFTETL